MQDIKHEGRSRKCTYFVVSKIYSKIQLKNYKHQKEIMYRKRINNEMLSVHKNPLSSCNCLKIIELEYDYRILHVLNNNSIMIFSTTRVLYVSFENEISNKLLQQNYHIQHE